MIASHSSCRAVCDHPRNYVSIGSDINGIDVNGVTFNEAWPERVQSQYEDQTVYVLSRRHLIQNKNASGRLQDLADVERLEELDRD